MTVRHGTVCGLDWDYEDAARDGVRARVGNIRAARAVYGLD
jgi:hypothetical protein